MGDSRPTQAWNKAFGVRDLRLARLMFRDVNGTEKSGIN